MPVYSKKVKGILHNPRNFCKIKNPLNNRIKGYQRLKVIKEIICTNL